MNHVDATPGRSHARTILLVRLAFILGLGALLLGASRSGTLSLDLGLPFAVLGVLWGLTLLAWSGTRFGASVPVLLGGQIALDLIFGTLLIGASGGTRSPLVLLPVVSILMAGSFLGRRAALLTAAGAWLGWGGIAWFIGDGAPLPPAHALWLICAYGGAFVVLAFLTGAQAERARRSESEVADASAELERQGQANERLLEFMPIGLMTVANDGAIARLNRAATDLLGRPAEDPIGANAADFLAALSPALVDALEASLVTQKWATREEVLVPGDDGEERWLGVAFTPLIQADELQEGVLITFSDLSGVRRMEDQMWRAEQLAKLGELAAGVAHEIRNPLASISGAIQVLGETSREGEDRELMDLIMRESERLNRTIDDVLDYTRDHSGSRSVHDVSQTVREVVRLIRHDQALTLGKTILMELPEDSRFWRASRKAG